mgnify:CR=1 FL=1
MTFDEYQQAAWNTAMYPNKGNNIYYPALGLGEAGEVQGKIKKIMRDDNGVVSDEKKQAIKAELGDVLWYIAALATEFGLTMDEIATANVDKLNSRKDRGVITGSGDNR